MGRDTLEASAVRDRLSTDRTTLAGAAVEKGEAARDVYEKRLKEAKALKTKGETWLGSQLVGATYKLEFDGAPAETAKTPKEVDASKKKIRVSVRAEPGLMVAGDVVLVATAEHKDLRAAVDACKSDKDPDVVAFLLRLAKGESIPIGDGKTYGLGDLQGAEKGWDYQVGKAFVNRQYLKRKFRAVKAKSHEWIPTDKLVQVVERAHSTRAHLDQGAKWVRAQNVLRSPTRGIIFKGRFDEFKDVVDAWNAAKGGGPEKEAEATKVAETALNSGKDVFAKHGFLSGHVGALYVRDTDNKLHPCVTGQEGFHNRLRALWTGHKDDPASYVGELLSFVEEEVWDGSFGAETFPRELAAVKTVNFKDARGLPLTQDPKEDTSKIPNDPGAVERAGVAFVTTLAELGARQGDNYRALTDMLDEARKELK